MSVISLQKPQYTDSSPVIDLNGKNTLYIGKTEKNDFCKRIIIYRFSALAYYRNIHTRFRTGAAKITDKSTSADTAFQEVAVCTFVL